MAAAMPPSAMTVCALPNSDLQMMAMRLPCCARLDGGAQPGAAGADHDDVVGVPFEVGHSTRSFAAGANLEGMCRSVMRAGGEQA